MDYEKKIRDYMNSSDIDTLYKSMLNNLFPELAESEDEKIRKELIFYLGDMPEDTELRNGVTNRDVLAWLEKQGESYTKRDVDNAYIECMAFAKDELEKQGKQKPYWSEEDEKRFKSCLNILQAKGLMGVTDTINSNWLKSLKERYTWKPSEEQLDALKRTQTGVIQFSVLQNLYNDLKKL